MGTLKRGMRGPEVRKLQLLLQAASKRNASLEADGAFGGLTYEAVKALQQDRGIKADGIADAKTWSALGLISTPPLTPTVGDDVVAPWMALAKAELGVREFSRKGKDNERIVDYHRTSKNLSSAVAGRDETPWCSSFVNWVMAQAGYRGTGHALAASWLKWRYGEEITPGRYGAIAVIKRKGKSSDKATGSSTGFHVGFFVSATASKLRLLGGNQGNRVKYSNFSLAAYEIKGHFWPLPIARDGQRLEFRLGLTVTV